MLCNCGSGKEKWLEYDYQNIPLCYVCEDCIDEKLSHYHPKTLTGYDQSDMDEDIEPDGDWY